MQDRPQIYNLRRTETSRAVFITERGDILEGLHNLKDRICDFENLMGAYRDAAKAKRYRNEVLDFTFNLGDNLHELQRELLDMT